MTTTMDGVLSVSASHELIKIIIKLIKTKLYQSKNMMKKKVTDTFEKNFTCEIMI